MGGSHRILLLFSPCTISTLFPVRTLLDSVNFPLISSVPYFSKAYPPLSARFRHTASALPILPSLLHSGTTAWHGTPCCGLLDLMQKPSTPFRTLYRLRHLVLMQFSIFPFSSLFSAPPANIYSSACIFPFCVNPHFLTVLPPNSLRDPRERGWPASAEPSHPCHAVG